MTSTLKSIYLAWPSCYDCDTWRTNIQRGQRRRYVQIRSSICTFSWRYNNCLVCCLVKGIMPKIIMHIVEGIMPNMWTLFCPVLIKSVRILIKPLCALIVAIYIYRYVMHSYSEIKPGVDCGLRLPCLLSSTQVEWSNDSAPLGKFFYASYLYTVRWLWGLDVQASKQARGFTLNWNEWQMELPTFRD